LQHTETDADASVTDTGSGNRRSDRSAIGTAGWLRHPYLYLPEN